MVAGTDQVGARAAVSGEGGRSVPVPGHFLMQFGAFECLLAGVVRPGHGEYGGEQPDLVGLGRESSGEVVAGMVAFGPVAVPVGALSPVHGLVVAVSQLGEVGGV